MIVVFIILLELVNAHSQQEKPKPRNLIHCGPTGYWNPCQNHRVWPSNGYKGDPIGSYPVHGGHPCVGEGPNGEANSEQFNAMSRAGEIQATYRAGETIDVEWKVLANHGGIYSWRLCLDADNPTEDCFKQNTLEIVGGAGQGRRGWRSWRGWQVWRGQ